VKARLFTDLENSELIELIRNDTIGVIPTDTQYGLVCSAANQMAIEQLYHIKQRERKPGTIIAANLEQLIGLGLKARYLKAVADYWPNAVSIVIPCGPELQQLHLGAFSLAVRIPKPEAFRRFLEKTGPLLTSSANLSSKPPANSIREAIAYFGDKVDFYVDGGNLQGRKPSTIIRVFDDVIEVLRPGAVTIDEAGRITEHEV